MVPARALVALDALATAQGNSHCQADTWPVVLTQAEAWT